MAALMNCNNAHRETFAPPKTTETGSSQVDSKDVPRSSCTDLDSQKNTHIRIVADDRLNDEGSPKHHRHRARKLRGQEHQSRVCTERSSDVLSTGLTKCAAKRDTVGTHQPEDDKPFRNNLLLELVLAPLLQDCRCEQVYTL